MLFNDGTRITAVTRGNRANEVNCNVKKYDSRHSRACSRENSTLFINS